MLVADTNGQGAASIGARGSCDPHECVVVPYSLTYMRAACAHRGGRFVPLSSQAVTIQVGMRVLVKRSTGAWAHASVAAYEPWPPEGGTVTLQVGEGLRKTLNLAKERHIAIIRVPRGSRSGPTGGKGGKGGHGRPTSSSSLLSDAYTAADSGASGGGGSGGGRGGRDSRGHNDSGEEEDAEEDYERRRDSVQRGVPRSGSRGSAGRPSGSRERSSQDRATADRTTADRGDRDRGGERSSRDRLATARGPSADRSADRSADQGTDRVDYDAAPPAPESKGRSPGTPPPPKPSSPLPPSFPSPAVPRPSPQAVLSGRRTIDDEGFPLPSPTAKRSASKPPRFGGLGSLGEGGNDDGASLSSPFSSGKQSDPLRHMSFASFEDGDLRSASQEHVLSPLGPHGRDTLSPQGGDKETRRGHGGDSGGGGEAAASPVLVGPNGTSSGGGGERDGDAAGGGEVGPTADGAPCDLETAKQQFKSMPEPLPLVKGWRVIVQRSDSSWSYASVSRPQGGLGG